MRRPFGLTVPQAMTDLIGKAQTTADNARQMVLNRDPKLNSLEDVAKTFTTVTTAADATHADLYAKIAALKPSNIQIEYRDGLVVPAILSLLGLSATVDVTLTWPTAFPDTNYVVTPQVATAVAGLIGKTSATLKAKTTTGCVVTVTTTAVIAAGQATLSAVAYRKI